MVGSRHPVVAVVPARGGSKRIPRKNIAAFRGKPLLARTTEMLVASRLFDHVVVSTDDDEIAAVAVEAGAQVPFRRPAHLADDHTGARPVIIHAIEQMEAELAVELGPVCIVYPTAVFVEAADLSGGLAQLEGSAAEFVFSAVEYDAPVERAFRIQPDGTPQLVNPEHVGTRSQDLEPSYHDAGQFYWGTRIAWLGGQPVLESRSLVHVLPRWRVQDIDTPDDWTRAELIHRLLREQ
jgi:N-acylneuraminate cytidylyltransferase